MTNEIGNYRTNISITIRVSLLAEADKKADDEDISRSALFELAMKDYLKEANGKCNDCGKLVYDKEYMHCPHCGMDIVELREESQ